ncbi:transcriptional regulator, LysR family [Cohaesibacter marisflavi]|uniref:Transcriptional regulator, LysR family n=1 Tax=Cohaesibacter marisflavi TaxID=655353 RepID=A0A1I5N733_9HYPH|nr:LysR family transcriptional regulator [Cohaesibacter marisflavi]SFP17412.1 transcriptional regulator, LysR family [Cohaesibacter marisflavi]
MKTSLSELTAFMAIAEHQNFRASARELGISPSALSHTIKTMEANLEVRLFNRTTRSVALTEAGTEFLHRVGPVMEELKNALEDVSSIGNKPSGTIRISAAESAGKLLINGFLPDFLKAYPEIHVEIVDDTRFIDIVAEGYDAGMRILDDIPQDMVAIRLTKDFQFMAVASPQYLSVHDAPQKPQDLFDHQCIRFRFRSGALYPWDLVRHGQSSDINVNGPMTLGNSNLMVDAALAGIGIAWAPEYLVVPHLQSGRLVQLLKEWSPTFPGVGLYYPANRHPPAAFQLFTQALRKWAISPI